MVAPGGGPLPAQRHQLAGACVGPLGFVANRVVIRTRPALVFLHSPRGQNGHRRAPQRVPRPTGLRHYDAAGPHWPRTLHPRVGSHRRRPLPSDPRPNPRRLSLPTPNTKIPSPAHGGGHPFLRNQVSAESALNAFRALPHQEKSSCQRRSSA